MRFYHLADLHLGKRLNEFSLIEDQRYILERILALVEQDEPEAVLLAGDIYDKPLPPAEAVELFDDFLTCLAEGRRPVFLIGGNHDSPERLAFGSRILKSGGIHVARRFAGPPEPVTLTDDHGAVDFYLLPFIRPAHVRALYPDEAADSYQEALERALRGVPLRPERRNVLLAHQFVAGNGWTPERSDSEQIAVGGVDEVDWRVFDGFDYVALGHLHGSQKVGRETVRYAGSPLKYSLSEVRQEKSLTCVELGEKGRVAIETVPLKPLRDVREIRGPIERLLDSEIANRENRQDYLRVTLTDETPPIDPLGKLRAVYPNILRLDYENRRTMASQTVRALDPEDRDPLRIFAEFYEAQNGAPPDDNQMAVVREIWAQSPGGEVE